jgi:hypothetical protein
LLQKLTMAGGKVYAGKLEVAPPFTFLPAKP